MFVTSAAMIAAAAFPKLQDGRFSGARAAVASLLAISGACDRLLARARAECSTPHSVAA
jgi:hypothetical protein